MPTLRREVWTLAGRLGGAWVVACEPDEDDAGGEKKSDAEASARAKKEVIEGWKGRLGRWDVESAGIFNYGGWDSRRVRSGV